MRLGSNPRRTAQAARFTDVVLTAVTHLPELTGYHAKRFDVVKACLTSMRQFGYTVMVWDNGSCDTLRDWIANIYQPEVFIQSENIGKTQARLAMARMLSGRVMAYSDDDILFTPNWLQPQLELMRHFPNVACVTGYPTRTSFRWGNANTKAWGGKHGKIHTGRYLPNEWERDFALSLGRDPTSHMASTITDFDTIIEYNGVKAYATAHHCQFIALADNIVKASQTDNAAMGDERPFDVAMDRIGLRLATLDRLTRHIGNIIDDEIRGLIPTV